MPASLPGYLQLAGVVGSVAALLLIVLNVGGHFRVSFNGLPESSASQNRVQIRRSFSEQLSSGPADDLSAVLKAAADEANLQEDIRQASRLAESNKASRMHLLEESPPSSASSAWSSASSSMLDKLHAAETAKASNALSSADTPSVLSSSQRIPLAVPADASLKQELLQRNLERPQIQGSSDAYDGPWDQRYFEAASQLASAQGEQPENLPSSQAHLQQQMPASHLQPVGSKKRFLRDDDDFHVVEQQPNCPAAVELERLEKLPFCHSDMSLPALPTASVRSSHDSHGTAHGLPRAQARARSHRMQGAARQQEEEIDTCTALLSVKKVALLFLTRGELYHTQLWSAWLEAAAGGWPVSALTNVVISQYYRAHHQAALTPGTRPWEMLLPPCQRSCLRTH